MKPPDIPENEPERLRELHKLDILDTPSEAVFDDLTRLASMACGTLFSTVSIIDHERQWFKSAQGPLGITETTRDVSFCGHAMLGDELFIIEDALSDERFRDNPVVTGGPMIRFYAGAPLKTAGGHPIGTLCVFDPKPKTLTETQKESLVLLARQVEAKLEQRVSDAIAENMTSILGASDTHIILFDPVQERVHYIDNNLHETLGQEFDPNSRVLFSRLFPDLPYDRFFAPERMNDSELAMRKITRSNLPGRPDGKADLRLLNARDNQRHNRILLYRDKTELVRSRSDAKTAESRLRVFYNLAMQSKNAFVVTDAEGRVEWVNASFETMTGYSRAEMIGRKPGEMLQGEETSPQDRDRISRHLAEKKPVVQEILNYHKSGKAYWIELYIEPIFDESGVITHFAATQNNVTRRKEENQLLRQSRAEAERANRAKSQFLAKISHELRTPLNGIIGITEKLLAEVPDSLKGTIVTLDQSSQHLMTLLDDLLDLSHIESGHLQLASAPFSPDNLLTEINELFSSRAAMVGNTLTLDVPAPLPPMLAGDETRLRQVLMNLVNNAVKFTRDGQVSISARLRSPSSDTASSRILFAVADTGPGIAPDDQQRVFESFEQLDNSSTRTHGGSGLGLAICKQLVEAMGGKISLKSQVGKGAEFSFELSFPAVSPVNQPDSPQPLPGRLGRLEHVLVIDDNEINCTVLSDLLKRFGVPRVYTAGSARRGLAILENIQPDLLLIDLQMPDMNGFELIEHLHRLFSEQRRSVPLAVACTAEVSDDKRQLCLDAGFDAHLGKPVTGKSLGRLITDLGFELETAPNPSPVNEEKPMEPERKPEQTTGNLDAGEGSMINQAALISAFLGNEALLKEFLSLLAENLPEHTTRIREAIKTGTIQAHSDAAHSIKGLVGYFENPALKQQADALETAMKAGEISLVRESFAILDSLLNRLLAETRALLPRL